MVSEKPWLRNAPGWEKSNGMHQKQIHRRKGKKYRKEGRLCQQITIMRKAMTNYTCFAHNFLKVVLVRN
jgi:hypothetical protein